MQPTATGGELVRVERITRNRAGLWVAIAITLVGLLLFTGLFNILIPAAGANLGSGPLVVLGLILSLVPAAIWLAFFYRLDRLEPEPKALVLGVFVLGALAAGALHDPLIEGLFGVSQWRQTGWWAHLFGAILIVGFIEQAMIYFTVRLSVFDHPEFDERVDGVIYAVAAGLGIATVQNFRYVLAHQGVDLDIGSIRMVINALAYASFAGILGYFIGQVRFEKTPATYLPLGFAATAIGNGLFWYLLDLSEGRGLTANPWNGLVFAAVVAVLTLAVVFWLIERANEETLRIAHRAARAAASPATSLAPDAGAQPTGSTPQER